jgi:hypothetical protein
MSLPKLGDVILRGSAETGFMVVDAVTRKSLAGPAPLEQAIQLAKDSGAIAIWQENTDERGRAMGLPFRIPLS